MEHHPYSVTLADGRVDAWSAARLPFEPKGWLRDYRSDLQSALRSIRATSTSILYAEYAAPVAAFADLENVLLYNVGSGCYSHLARRGVVCRRALSVDHLHHVTYANIEPADVTAPRGPILATGRLTVTPPENTPAYWWAAFRRGLETHVNGPIDGEFGVVADVGSTWRRSLAPSIKAVLDGLIAALHVHDGSQLEHVTTALNDVGDGELLWRMLNDPATAILGRRRLVRPHGQTIAWNPADERCGYFAFVRGAGQDAITFTVVTL